MVTAPKNILTLWSPLLGTIFGYFRSILDIQFIPQFPQNCLIFFHNFFYKRSWYYSDGQYIKKMTSFPSLLGGGVFWGIIWSILVFIPLFLENC